MSSLSPASLRKPKLEEFARATGVFSSRQIECATHENVVMRLLCADAHSDHDTLCTFRRRNAVSLQRALAQVLDLLRATGRTGSAA